MKKFLKESPVIWALTALVVVLILLGITISNKDWGKSILLVVLISWILLCIKRDYTIWKLTKRGKK